MGRIADDYATLLDSTSQVEADLAQGLLTEAGIPCLLHGPDFDRVELGNAMHGTAFGVSVYVPHAALERARSILRAAWPEGAGEVPPAPA
jgi:hypothetical protein